MRKIKPKLIVIAGPTASGKSELAVHLAKKFNGEIISADSRQIYKRLDIATGKVPGKWTSRKSDFRLSGSPTSGSIFLYKSIPHYCIDIANPKKQYSVAEFQTHAKTAIADIVSRGKLPIVAGGTGFWIDALIYGQHMPDVPPDKKLRAFLEKKSAEKLFTLLKKLDPARAKSVDPHNPRRLMRAIEIAKTIGKVPKIKKEMAYDTLWLGILPPKEKLKATIHKRLVARIHQGMIQEARKLHREGLTYKRMRELGLEYRYLADFLEKKIDKKAFLLQLEKAINDYAKRQMTWFGRNRHIQWIANLQEAEKILGKNKHEH
ncbi:MAG: hypothetical protein A3C84_05345 [Candidatus Ryanbacteria bacterium RIFCSPHIGHO2_02_FULL_48_12]|uniref:tRNA dimethylallyltransferase n=1 Tax=Candidatus Ryanbacteria bacterium RIFCSPHIGHO2_01_FULL_48_27 TaxID=1802115 RepID=A0A1G2G5X0_9BACT|nr:MAG: hypothetical protein A2756_01925 [Candidatus Ryanbacteria bacterium RIFCSPHIGHO2_01_FULL_48_27]OGZ50066.1 MAG: hypothetical protein A3C84_05345 [Candidatus Ryanbacteria bacterium RIFCSPHIGHO2_02_FULL_48_12]